MDVKGTVLLRYRYLDSKSEGWYAYLVSSDLKIYQMARKDIYPVNDSFFYDFDKTDAVVTGTIMEEKFLLVEDICLLDWNGLVKAKEDEKEVYE